MPRMGGPEATREIRRLEGEDFHIPIVAVTADAMTDHQEQYLAAGMDGVASKPIDLDRLLDVMDRTLGEKVHTSNIPIAEVAAEKPGAPAARDEAESSAETSPELEALLQRMARFSDGPTV